MSSTPAAPEVAVSAPSAADKLVVPEGMSKKQAKKLAKKAAKKGGAKQEFENGNFHRGHCSKDSLSCLSDLL